MLFYTIVNICVISNALAYINTEDNADVSIETLMSIYNTQTSVLGRWQTVINKYSNWRVMHKTEFITSHA